MRFAEIIRGLTDGYKSEGKELASFHGLGLGAPILFPILSLAMGAETNLTIDSTSPIMNAVRLNTLFNPERDGERNSFIEIIEKIFDGKDWSFMCPFCKKYKDDFGHKPEAARKWWIQNERPKIKKKDLKSGSPLSKMIPLFTKQKKTTKIKKFSDSCRIAHNHWVVEHILDQIPVGKDRVSWARKKIDEMISYESTRAEKSLKVMKEIILKT